MQDVSTAVHLVEGKTRWRRFGLAFLPGMAAVGTMLYLIATGVIAISLSISGIPFVLKADTLAGNDFMQWATASPVTNSALITDPFIDGSLVANQTSTLNAAGQWYAADTVTHFGSASIDNLKQWVCAPTPFGNKLLVVTEGDATATNLTAYAPGLKATSADFSNMFIGQENEPMGFTQQADNATISGVTQFGLATTAATFSVSGLTSYAAFVSTCPAVP